MATVSVRYTVNDVDQAIAFYTLAVVASDCPECRQFMRRTPLTPVRGLLD
jgi:hypothetical protein